MSLFKVIEWWNAQVNLKSGSSSRCLTVCQFSEDNNEMHLVVADHGGLLSVFYPTHSPEDRSAQNVAPGVEEGTTVDDLCVEYDTKDSIVQIVSGKFNHAANKRSFLAVLHYHSAAVYGLTKSNGEGSTSLEDNDAHPCICKSVESWSLDEVFSVRFDKPAFDICVCSVGGDNSKEGFCVQSVESFIYVYHGPQLMVTCRLNDCVLPGPLLFSQTTCSFITVFASIEIQSFSFNTLILSGTSDPLTVQKKSAPSNGYSVLKEQLPRADWKISVVEPVFQLDIIGPSQTIEECSPLSFLCVLCRNQLKLLSETGTSLAGRRFDLAAKFMLAYGSFNVTQEDGSEDQCCGRRAFSWVPRILVVTEENQLLVLTGTRIMWSATLPWSPVSITVPRASNPEYDKGLHPRIGRDSPPGLVALMSSNGLLSLFYLGSDPSPLGVTNLTTDGTTDGEQPNFGSGLPSLEALNSEMNQLNKRIRDLVAGDILPSQSKENVQILTQLRSCSVDAWSNDVSSPCIDICLVFPPHTDPTTFDPVHLVVAACPPVNVCPNYINFPPAKAHMGGAPNSAGRSGPKRSFKRFCTLKLSINNEHPLAILPPLDLTVRIQVTFNGRGVNNCLKSTVPTTVETLVRIPLQSVCCLKKVDKSEIGGTYVLDFQLVENPRLGTFRPKEIFSNFWSSEYEGDLCIHLCFPQTGDHDLSTEKNTAFLSLSDCGITLQSDCAPGFLPVIQELYLALTKFVVSRSPPATQIPRLLLRCSQNGDTNDEENKSVNNSSFVYQSGPFFDELLDLLSQHVEVRLAQATGAAADVVQSRHFRAVQWHVLNHIKDNIPAPLNGFDTLLEASLHNLIEGCDTAAKASQLQILTGASAISLVVLLCFLSTHCAEFARPITNDSCLESAEFLNRDIFQPSRLLSIIESTELVELGRGSSALPEQQFNEVDEAGPTPNPPVGLEEYLAMSITKILGMLEPIGSRRPPTSYSGSVPDVKLIVQDFRLLCSKLSNMGSEGLSKLFRTSGKSAKSKLDDKTDEKGSKLNWSATESIPNDSEHDQNGKADEKNFVNNELKEPVVFG
ncbi:unnamed protein product [Calicophoron daubneyi]|uniref:Protein PTHB1 n=1 Tax=Calicophoron daubneyi TaxID=300641 RepID=A0AAV2TGR7_CALDB